MTAHFMLAPFLLDYPRSGEGAEFLALLSYVEEKRKKRGFLSGGEELIEYVGKGHLHVRAYRGEGFSLLYDPECRFLYSLRLAPLEELKIFESWALNPLVQPPRVRRREVRVPGLVHPSLADLLRAGREGSLERPSDDCLDSILGMLEGLKPERLEEEIKEIREIKMRVEGVAAPLKALELVKQGKGGRARDNLSTVRFALSREEEARQELIEALSPPLVEGAVPYYVVRTRGAKRRTFVVSALKFRGKDVGFRVKGLLGRFDSLFEESRFTRLISSSLKVEEAGPNLLDGIDQEEVIGEFALVQEEVGVNYKYLDSVIYLLNRSRGG